MTKTFWLNLRRVLQSGFLNFWRTPVVSLASVVALTVALFVIGALVLGSVFVGTTLEELRSRVDVSVTFKPDAPTSEILALKQSLEKLEGVTTVDYRSREEELADFRERNLENELILRSLDEIGNPFGARLNIRATDPAHYEKIAAFLEEDPALLTGGGAVVDEIVFHENIVGRLVGLINTARKIGLAVTGVLVFISLVVTFNTISLAIYTSREEIALMKLVGASNHYVRGPFVVEGLMAGLLASFLALALLYPGLLWLRNVSAELYGGLNLVSYYVNNFTNLFLALAGLGMGLGALASGLAIKKHLQV